VFALACVAAFGLAACGGGGSTPPSAAKTKSQGAGRKVMSVPCTPDSYGYCYVTTYHSSTRTDCGNHVYAVSAINSYEVYNSTTDLGTYTESVEGSCTDPTQFFWDPSDPAVDYGDPNLP
jgi:hypothetical protein